MKPYTCIGVAAPDTSRHAEMDAYGKTNGLTVTYAAWHLNPEYRVFQTGSLAEPPFPNPGAPPRNAAYPSGLVLIDDSGKPHPYTP